MDETSETKGEGGERKTERLVGAGVCSQREVEAAVWDVLFL